MVVCTDDFTALELLAHRSRLDPLILHDLLKRRPLFRVDLEHASDDVAALAGEKPEQTPRTLDGLLSLRRRRCVLGIF